MYEGSWTIKAFDRDAAALLARELEISGTTAAVLVRRSYDDVARARAFLAGELPAHDPFELGDMAAACETIRGAIAAGRRICVHGDYDADGICATTLAVLILRELGAEVEWHLPSRFDEGYGVREETLSRLAGDGCGLVLTVDCGITASAEVAAAKALGLEIVVSDHHRPAEELPDCPLVGPYRESAYPFGELCGTGVVFKLGQALLGVDSEALLRHLDLVGIATIADVVPLVDENRGLAIAGLRALASTQKPGLRELMKVARVDPAAADAASVGFRLAPRLNAAGRLDHPEAALELLLTEDRDQGARLAHRLDELNRDRQTVEERILREAVEEIESWPEAKQRQRGYVLARAEGHEGVIGIVASRLVERYHRPVVLIAAGERGGKGWDGSRDAGSAIAFGFGRQLDRFRQELRFDIAFRLEENHWNGTVAPQLVVRRVFDGKPRYRELRDWLAGLWREQADAWPPEAAAIFGELELGANEPRRRHLLESATFCRLLEMPSGLAEAA